MKFVFTWNLSFPPEHMSDKRTHTWAAFCWVTTHNPSAKSLSVTWNLTCILSLLELSDQCLFWAIFYFCNPYWSACELRIHNFLTPFNLSADTVQSEDEERFIFCPSFKLLHARSLLMLVVFKPLCIAIAIMASEGENLEQSKTHLWLFSLPQLSKTWEKIYIYCAL